MSFSFRRWVAKAFLGNRGGHRKRSSTNTSMSSVAALTVALSIDQLEDRTLMAADIGINIQPQAVPGETVTAQVWYIGDTGGGGRAGGNFGDYFGPAILGPTPTEIDNPSDGVFVGTGFELVGGDANRGARQFYFPTGDRGSVEYFESLLSAGGGTGNSNGRIYGVSGLVNGSIIYVGDSFGTTQTTEPTYWLNPLTPQTGYISGGLQGGFLLSASTSGVFIGSSGAGANIYGYLDSDLYVLPGAEDGAPVAISFDGSFVVGTGGQIWHAAGTGYSVYSTAGFDFTAAGGTPTWRGVEVDGNGEVFFAGEFFDLNTFATSVGYWNGDGDYLGSRGVSFADFDVVGGEVVAAVNGFDDGALVRVRDGQFVTIAELTGSAATFPAKGLFTTDGALGLLLQDGDGMFVTVLDTINTPTGGDPQFADLFIDFNSDGTVDQILRGVNGQRTLETSFLRAGNYTATVIAKDSAGNELGRSTDTITVSAYRVENGVLIIGADQTRGSNINVTQQRNGSLRVSVDNTRGTVNAFFVEVIGSSRADRVLLSGSFSADVNLYADNDSLTAIGVNIEANLGDGNDSALAIRSGEVRFIGGAGNDRLRSIGHQLAFFDGGLGNDSILSSGKAAFAIGGDGRDSFTILDRHSVVVSVIVNTQTPAQYDALVDSVFAELSKPNPNRNTVTSLFAGLITDDDDQDSGLVLSRWAVKLQGRRDRIR